MNEIDACVVAVNTFFRGIQNILPDISGIWIETKRPGRNM